MADNSRYVTAAISAENTGTEWLILSDGGRFDLSIIGLFDSTITLQRKRPGEADSAARDVDAYTANTEEMGESAGQWLYRLFCKSGDYGTDAPVIEVNS